MADVGDRLRPHSTVPGLPNCRAVTHLFGQLLQLIRQAGLERATLDDVLMSAGNRYA